MTITTAPRWEKGQHGSDFSWLLIEPTGKLDKIYARYDETSCGLTLPHGRKKYASHHDAQQAAIRSAIRFEKKRIVEIQARIAVMNGLEVK